MRRSCISKALRRTVFLTTPLTGDDGGGGSNDEDQALGMGRDIIEKERALPFLGAALTERQQPAEPAVSRAIGRIGKQVWRILQIEPDADDKFDAGLLGGEMGANRAGKRVAVGDGDGVESQGLGRRHQFLGMGAAGEKGEIAGDLELGVAGHGEGHHPKTPCRYQQGGPNSLS